MGRAAYLFLVPESIGKTNEALILMTVITLAAAVDSNIFLFSRFQEERIKKSKGKALASTYKNTLPSVFTSLIAILSSFSIFAFSSFTIFYSASIAVSIGLLVNMIELLTLTPSIIWLFGDKIAYSKTQRKNKEKNRTNDPSSEVTDENTEGIITKAITNGARWATKAPYTVMTGFRGSQKVFVTGYLILALLSTGGMIQHVFSSGEETSPNPTIGDLPFELNYAITFVNYNPEVLNQEDLENSLPQEYGPLIHYDINYELNFASPSYESDVNSYVDSIATPDWTSKINETALEAQKLDFQRTDIFESQTGTAIDARKLEIYMDEHPHDNNLNN